MSEGIKEIQILKSMFLRNGLYLSFYMCADTCICVVGDGLKETKAVFPSFSKLSKLSSLLHSSTTFKYVFDADLGEQKGIPAAVNRRWISTLRTAHL